MKLRLRGGDQSHWFLSWKPENQSKRPKKKKADFFNSKRAKLNAKRCVFRCECVAIKAMYGARFGVIELFVWFGVCGNGRNWGWALRVLELEAVTGETETISRASHSVQFGFNRRRRLPVPVETGGDRRLPRPHRRHNRSDQRPLEKRTGC